MKASFSLIKSKDEFMLLVSSSIICILSNVFEYRAAILVVSIYSIDFPWASDDTYKEPNLLNAGRFPRSLSGHMLSLLFTTPGLQQLS
jgi:hypothetical protein